MGRTAIKEHSGAPEIDAMLGKITVALLLVPLELHDLSVPELF